MAVKNPDFRVKHGLRVGGDAHFSQGLTATGPVRIAGANFGIDQNGSCDGDFVIAGDLTVNGNTTTVYTSAVAMEDPLISLGVGNSATDLKDIGFYGQYNTASGHVSGQKFAGLFRDASDGGLFKLFDTLSAEPLNAVSAAAAEFNIGNLQANLSGLAVSATKIDHDHTWQLVGEVTGSQSTDYSGALSQLTTTIPNNTISGNHINTAAVGQLQLASDAVTTVKIGDGQVTDMKLISSTSTDANRAVGQFHIKDDALQTRHFSAGVVTNAKLENDGMTINGVDVSLGGSVIVGLTGLTDTNSIDFTFSEVNGVDIVSADVIVGPTGSIEINSDGLDIKDASIRSAQISAGVVQPDHLSAGAVTDSGGGVYSRPGITDDKHNSYSIANSSMATSGAWSVNSVPMTLGGDFSISTLSNAVDSHSIDMHLSANGDTLSADVIIADNSLEIVSTGVRLKAAGLSAGHFGTGVVLADALATDSVETVKIKALNVTNAKLALSCVETNNIDADTVRVDHMQTDSVSRVKLIDGSVNDQKIDLDNAQFKTLNNTAVVSGGMSTIDSSLTASYRSVHYFVQANEGSDWQSSHVTLMHDGTDAYIMEHGIVSTKSDGEPFVTFDADMSSNNLNLLGKSSSTGATIKAIKSGIQS